jgi:hypothetical protein
MPQIIRKGVVYSRSKYCKKGLYFIIPEIVYKKFEDIIGSDIPMVNTPNNETISVFTYSLGQAPKNKLRALDLTRVIRFTLDDFSNRFISGPNLPKPEELDNSIKKILGVT